MSRRALIWLFGIAIAAIVIGILIYIFRCNIFKNLSSCVEDPNDNNVPIPSGSPTPKWVPETPPYNVGMFGPKIKALQKAMGFQSTDKDAPNYQDGYFGSETTSAITAKGKAIPLSVADYEAIVNPTASGGGTNFQSVKSGLGSAGQNFTGGVRGYMAGPNQVYRFDFYTNGRVFVYNSQGQEEAKGTYSNGGKKIVLDNGDVYNVGSVTLNMQEIANDLG